MQSIARISSSISEPWVAWTMVVLLLLLILTLSLQRGVILNSFRGLRTAKERDNLFDTTSPNLIGHICLECYKIGIFSLTLYTLLSPPSPFPIRPFFWIILCVIAFFLFKYLMARLIAYVFFSNNIFRIALRNYTGITTCCAVILYPILLFMLFLPQIGTTAMYILSGGMLVCYAILFLIKIFQFFFTQTLASVYIFLYLCTLEAIPFIGLIYIGNYVVN